MDRQLSITAGASESAWLLREQSCRWLEQRNRGLVVSGDIYSKGDHGWAGRKGACLTAPPYTFWLMLDFLSFFCFCPNKFFKIAYKEVGFIMAFLYRLCFIGLPSPPAALPDSRGDTSL